MKYLVYTGLGSNNVEEHFLQKIHRQAFSFQLEITATTMILL